MFSWFRSCKLLFSLLTFMFLSRAVLMWERVSRLFMGWLKVSSWGCFWHKRGEIIFSTVRHEARSNTLSSEEVRFIRAFSSALSPCDCWAVKRNSLKNLVVLFYEVVSCWGKCWQRNNQLLFQFPCGSVPGQSQDSGLIWEISLVLSISGQGHLWEASLGLQPLCWSLPVEWLTWECVFLCAHVLDLSIHYWKFWIQGTIYDLASCCFSCVCFFLGTWGSHVKHLSIHLSLYFPGLTSKNQRPLWNGSWFQWLTLYFCLSTNITQFLKLSLMIFIVHNR